MATKNNAEIWSKRIITPEHIIRSQLYFIVEISLVPTLFTFWCCANWFYRETWMHFCSQSVCLYGFFPSNCTPTRIVHGFYTLSVIWLKRLNFLWHTLVNITDFYDSQGKYAVVILTKCATIMLLCLFLFRFAMLCIDAHVFANFHPLLVFFKWRMQMFLNRRRL